MLAHPGGKTIALDWHNLQVEHSDARVSGDALRQHCRLTVTQTHALQPELFQVFVLLDSGRNLRGVFVGLALAQRCLGSVPHTMWGGAAWRGVALARSQLQPPADYAHRAAMFDAMNTGTWGAAHGLLLHASATHERPGGKPEFSPGRQPGCLGPRA